MHTSGFALPTKPLVALLLRSRFSLSGTTIWKITLRPAGSLIPVLLEIGTDSVAVVESKEVVGTSVNVEIVASEFTAEDFDCARVGSVSRLEDPESTEDRIEVCNDSAIVMEVIEVEASWVSVSITESIS